MLKDTYEQNGARLNNLSSMGCFCFATIYIIILTFKIYLWNFTLNTDVFEESPWTQLDTK